MKIFKSSEIESGRAFRVFKVLSELEFLKSKHSRAVFAVGSTHKEVNEVLSISKRLPVELIWAQRMKCTGFLRFMPIPKPIKFIFSVDKSKCIYDLVEILKDYLIIGIYSFDKELVSVSDFISSAKENSPFESLMKMVESDRDSFSYVVDFDNQECETGIMEYWEYDSSLANELSIYS